MLDMSTSMSIPQSRLNAFVFDATQDLQMPISNSIFDIVLLIFTLSAIKPQDINTVLKCVWRLLKHNGQVLIRDYGMYDHTQLRFGKEQQIQDRLYQRQDGTLSYYFTVEDLCDRMYGVGFQRVECKYACIESVNRKKGTIMRRVFIHGVFQKCVEGE
eukprot:TRINITY_DN10426_c0_g1_i1.p1 TRINITY_DN10426_c0_g1~~TRINITY_DN10426_c0_g1_i1.p1  ORF type:complete len:158 (-),score=5.69 TRINITY_DN10426_c0_g1_i1:81-554(-)